MSELHRYEVTAVKGYLTEQVKVGDIVQDEYKGDEYTWNVINERTGETTTMMTGKHIGKVSPDRGRL